MKEKGVGQTHAFQLHRGEHLFRTPKAYRETVQLPGGPPRRSTDPSDLRRSMRMSPGRNRSGQ